MYGLIFTSILVFILLFKIYPLRKNKRSNGSLEEIDKELIIMHFVRDLPKERIRRLCSLFEANLNTDWGSIGRLQ
ncbi:hypothetical protein V7128_14385 [Neobacillus vireti]|uniref:hypothetical protein n=1 Tax=Neobacillus vireti TaxID=220686 RepID=UPI002FFFCF7F